MKETGRSRSPEPGKYLAASAQPPAGPRTGRGPRRRRGLWVTVLLLWDGLLLYMIVKCLIVPVYGGLFIAVVSVWLGYQMKQEE